MNYFSPQKRTRKKRLNINGLFTDTLASSKYPETYLDLPRDIDNWACQQWRTYYERNKLKGGKQYAYDVFIKDANRISSIYSKAHSCKYDCAFVEWAKKEIGINFDWFTDVWCATDEVIENVSETATATTQTAKNVAKYVLPLAVIGAGFYAYNKYLK